MQKLVIPAACLVFLTTPALAQSPPMSAAPPPPPPASVPWGQQTDISGTVKTFTLTPVGDIEGIILTNGIEIHVPPHLTEQVAAAVRPGEAVAVRGWNTGVANFVVATALTGQRGQSVVDQGPPPPGTRLPPPGQAGAQMATVQGRIMQMLHGPRGDTNGAMLDDGTTLKLPPPAAWQLASLQPGQSIVAQGFGLSNNYGRVVEVQSIGPAQAAVPPPPAPAGLAAPPPPPPPHG